VTLREANGWWLFGVIWGLAILGIALEAFWVYARAGSLSCSSSAWAGWW